MVDDADYSRGRKSMATEIMVRCRRELGGYDMADADRLMLERKAAIAVLRSICDEHGDNDWPDNLHLADIIEKHLGNYLGS